MASLGLTAHLGDRLTERDGIDRVDLALGNGELELDLRTQDADPGCPGRERRIEIGAGVEQVFL